MPLPLIPPAATGAAYSIVGRTSAAGTSATPTVVYGSTPALNDIMLVYIGKNDYVSSRTPGSGWTELDPIESTLQDLEGGAFWWKRAGGSESTSQAPCVWGASTQYGAVAWLIRGLPTTGNPFRGADHASVVDDDASKGTPNVDPPDGTERMIIAAAVDNGNNAASAAQINGSATGVTLTMTGTGTGGSGIQVAGWDLSVLSIASGNYSGSLTAGGTSHAGVAAIIALGADVVTLTVSVGGTISPAGVVRKSITKSPAGATTPTGVQAKSIAKRLTAGLASSGSLAATKVLLVSRSGSITPAGAASVKRIVGSILGGTISPAGVVRRAVAKSLAGVLGLFGAYSTPSPPFFGYQVEASAHPLYTVETGSAGVYAVEAAAEPVYIDELNITPGV